MTAFDVLAKALRATALVVLLSLAWAVPANAHAGHGAASKAVAPVAKHLRQEARQSVATGSRAAERAALCDPGPNGAPAPAGGPQDEGAQGRTCCGTMCTVALIEHAIASLPVRTPHRIRLDMRPETPPLVQALGLHARPPRTNDIA